MTENNYDHIKGAMESERFEQVTALVYSQLVTGAALDSQIKKTMTPKLAMDTAMTAAYLYAVNFEIVRNNHIKQRIKEAHEREH